MTPRHTLGILALIATSLGSVSGATLEKLTTDDLVQKSTDIVRAKVISASTSYRGTAGRGGMIYTHYTLQIVERWKGLDGVRMDLAVPGGTVGNIRQTFPGAPTLEPSIEYVFFLWTSRTGLTQIMGLSQGLLTEKVDASGATILYRNASAEPMVDSAGTPVTDSGFRLPLAAFRTTMQSYGLASK